MDIRLNDSKRIKISIVTATHNSESVIGDAIRSVLEQTYGDIEHIIVDGASSDGTIEIVKSFENLYEGRLRWISEKDTGIYDALNKGVSMATGDVVGFLHSDDFFRDAQVVEKIAAEFGKDDELEGIYGNLAFVDAVDPDKIKRIWIAGKGSFQTGWTIPHQTLYLKKTVYEKYGGYLTDMRNAADNEFILRVVKDGGIKLAYINEILVMMKLGGASTKDLNSSRIGFKEVQRSLEMHHIKFPYLVNSLRLACKIKQVVRAKIEGLSNKNRRGI